MPMAPPSGGDQYAGQRPMRDKKKPSSPCVCILQVFPCFDFVFNFSSFRNFKAPTLRKSTKMAANNDERLNLNEAYIQVILDENGYVAFDYVQFGNLVRSLRHLALPVEYVAADIEENRELPVIGYMGLGGNQERPLRHLNLAAVRAVAEIEKIEDNREVPPAG